MNKFEPLNVGQRVIIRPRRRRGKTKAEMTGTVTEITGEAAFGGLIYRVLQDNDRILGTFSGRQLTPLTPLDEMARL